MPAPSDRWDRFREQMPVCDRWAYLDHAAVAPLSGPAGEAIAGWLREATDEGATVWPAWSRGVERARAAGARLLGAATEEIALVHSTTEGINLVAEGYRWQPGDNVVTLADEFPSNQYPWLNLADRGVETRRLPTDEGRLNPAALAAACDDRTRIVSLSWVGYATGFRHDLAAVAEVVHDRGALLFVDAIQGLGVFPLDVARTPIDFLAADGHKWLLGPEGAGLFYVRREHLARLRPLGVGWNSVVHAHDFTHIDLDLKPSAARYEGGTQNMAGFLGLAASLELLLEHGTEAIAARVLAIADLAVDRLQSLGARVVSCREDERRSGIVAFELPGADPVDVRRRCLQAGVVVSCRAGRLRISPHAYNNDDDIGRLIEVLGG
jgi:selenocysteine lyase/cysteine desulfurase